LVALYVTSLEPGSGKTAVCAGIGKHLLSEGKETGFLKPVISEASKTIGDGDADFIKQLFAISEPVESLAPVISEGSNLAGGIKEAYDKVSQNQAIVIIEGQSEQFQSSSEIVKALDARVVIVEAYSGELLKDTDSYKEFGAALLGIVLTKVPKIRLEKARTEATDRLEKTGIKLLGVLPEDRILTTMTIGEVAELVKGEIFYGAAKAEELVENLMLGALALDPGPEYFARKVNKAVVLKSERTDMQLAAMQTSSRCLVLTGETPLNPLVIADAEKKDIPIILAKEDVSTVADIIENAMINMRFHQQNKMPKLTEIVEQNFDFQTVYQELGLAS